jgi:hypothetical protein
MHPEKLSKEDRALGALLREWKVDEPLPPRFGEAVWRRMAQNEIPSAHPVLILREWFAQALARPSFALSYASILLLIGLGAGLWEGRLSSTRAAETLSKRYVQMVDPYLTPGR